MDAAQTLFLQYALRRSEILTLADRFADALEEDRSKNADMFDTNSLHFSGNRHPNSTMRRIEEDLQKADLPFLYLLAALSDTGLELCLGLLPDRTPQGFAAAAQEIFDLLEAQQPPAVHLARKLTEIKAEHALKRLTAAIQLLDR